jgi:DNA-binding beta-propeller fold protein YncE
MPVVSIPLTGALSPILVPGAEELLVSNSIDANLTRIAAPFATPAPNGTITGAGIAPQVQKMLFVRDQLFLVNPGAGNVDRVTLDSQGLPAMIDAVMVALGRGIAFDPARRRLYVTQCCGVDRLLVFDVASDNSLTLVISLPGLFSPHGVIVTPWDEVLVANLGTNTIGRFRIKSDGIPTAIGTFTGPDMSGPIDFALTPWNELYVTSLNNGRISRFTFDESNDGIARDSFAVPNGVNLTYLALDVR